MEPRSNPLPALRRLIDHSLTVADIVSGPLRAVHEHQARPEAIAVLTALRFDVAGVDAQPITEFVTLERLRASDAERVRDVAEPIPASLCIERTLPLGRLFEQLLGRPYLFVLDGDHVRWVVTRADLRAPAVSASVLAYLVVIEEGLRHLVVHDLDATWLDRLSPHRQKQIRERFALLAKSKTEISLDLCANFGDWLNLAGQNETVRGQLGFPSKKSFKAETGALPDLRNDVAHGRTLFDNDAVDKALGRVVRLRDLADRIWWQVDTLGTDWDKYASTIIVTPSGRVLAGPGAAAVPWPSPVHVVTAWNPGSALWPEEENRAANKSLAAYLEERGLDASAVVGHSPDGRWSEESFLVPGVTRDQATAIGAQFGQRAIFELDDEHLHVIRCADDAVVRTRERRS